MSFPQFYLHYDSKNDKTLKVDQSPIPDQPFTIAIAIEETLSKKLLAGVIDETHLVVNQYADPPYVIDKALFPKDSKFYFIFSSTTFDIKKIVAKLPSTKALLDSEQDFIQIDNRIAFSLLSGDTKFIDWQIKCNETGNLIAAYLPANSDTGSALFKNRIDFLSFVEIDSVNAKLSEKNIQHLCDIQFNYLENSIKIACQDLPKENFADFFIAITEKNDPSYLINTIQMGPNKQLNLIFTDKTLNEMSFFTSRFHLRATSTQINNCVIGKVKIKYENSKVVISNDLVFGDSFSEVLLVFTDKYDQTAVYRTVKLIDNDKIELLCHDIDVNSIEVHPLKISKKFITQIR